MIYFLAAVSGIIGSVVGFILFGVLAAFLLRRPEGVAEVGIDLLGPMPLAFAGGGFVFASAIAIKFLRYSN